MMLSFVRCLCVSWLSLLASAGLMVGGGLCASQAQTAPAADGAASANGIRSGTRAFDVVSIRLHQSDSQWMITGDADSYKAMGQPFVWLILSAYLPPAYWSRDRVVGAPEWVLNDKYDFVGKLAPEDVAAWQQSYKGIFAPNEMLQELLQTTLADRCKLAVHRVPAEASGFALVVGKRGPKLKEAQPDEVVPSHALHIPDDSMMVPIMSHDNPVLTYFHTSMTGLAAQIQQAYGRPVLDQTGLTGRYDFMIERMSLEQDPSVALDVGSLGLMLKPIKLPTFAIVIDHIERPSEN